MARAAQEGARQIAILRGEGCAVPGVHGRRLGNGLVDDAVALLLGVKVVVAVKDSRDARLHKEVVNGASPIRALGREPVGAVEVLAAPLVEDGGLRATAHGIHRAADQVVNEDEFVAGCTGCQPLLQEGPLGLAQRPEPWVSVGATDGEGEGVEDHEEGVAPLVGIEVAAAGCAVVAAVEGIGRRVSKVGTPAGVGPGREVVEIGLAQIAHLTLVVAGDEEERQAGPQGGKVVALEGVPGLHGRQVGRPRNHGRERGGVLLRHEGIAEVEVEVGCVEPDVLERDPIASDVRVLVEMGVGLNREDEGLAGRARSLKVGRDGCLPVDGAGGAP